MNSVAPKNNIAVIAANCVAQIGWVLNNRVHDRSRPPSHLDSSGPDLVQMLGDCMRRPPASPLRVAVEDEFYNFNLRRMAGY